LTAAAPLLARDGDFPFARKEKPPAWPQNLTWLNSAGPLELRELRGKFVLLDFWTYCCINCMHILPELHKLEQTWPKNLVVIGVHSAKFSTEQQTPNILAAIQRYKIEHPVVNDARHELWDAYGVQVWPTLVLIDPEGNAVWGTSGEVTFEQIDKLLRTAMPYYRQRHLLDETPLRFNMPVPSSKGTVPFSPIRKSGQSPATPLRFPGKIIADEAGGRLFIADSNHNRIVVARFDGTLLELIGSGAAGQKDGDFGTAEFNQPQGLALHGNDLYVADTENHEIRRVDLAAGKVATVAGTGRQARGNSTVRRDARHTALSSPWDLFVHGGDLFIAMAGCHQIWKMKLDGSAIGPYAGNGVEDIVDGPLLPPRPFQTGYASFAQPSGLASDGKWLFVADSEGSSIRAVPLDPRRQVRTVVGTAQLPAGRLFTFGDADGPAGAARFQHPLGVLYYGGKIYVADTYNSKIRIVDPLDGSVRTLADKDLFEPAALTAAGGQLFVADTNNHRICTIDPKTGQVAPLTIAGLKPPEPPTAVVKRALSGEKLPLTAVRVDHGQVRLRVELELPPGYELNPLAPLEYVVNDAGSTDGPVARDSLGKSVRIEKPAAEFEIALPVKAATGRDTIHVSVDYYYCREGAEGICKVGSAAWIAPLEFSDKAESSVVRLHQRAR
jgi:sugar lactone lactonase YvrE/thiol-disulfide isomerase/thioredoxin